MLDKVINAINSMTEYSKEALEKLSKESDIPMETLNFWYEAFHS